MFQLLLILVPIPKPTIQRNDSEKKNSAGEFPLALDDSEEEQLVFGVRKGDPVEGCEEGAAGAKQRAGRMVILKMLRAREPLDIQTHVKCSPAEWSWKYILQLPLTPPAWPHS